jgi:hypothetical protein
MKKQKSIVVEIHDRGRRLETYSMVSFMKLGDFSVQADFFFSSIIFESTNPNSQHFVLFTAFMNLIFCPYLQNK